MNTAEKYMEMGFMELGKGKVQDKQGHVYYPKKSRSPLQAIKFMCRECMGQTRLKQKSQEGIDLVRECTDPMCPLYDFRMGKNPFLGRTMSPEQRKAAAKRFALYRETNKDVEDKKF